MESAMSILMKRILVSTRIPLLLSLAFLSACATHNHAELTTLEVAQQETHKEVVAVRAQLEVLNARLAKMHDTAHSRPGHVASHRSHSEVASHRSHSDDVSHNSDSGALAKQMDDNVRSTGEFSYEIKRNFANTVFSNPSPIMRGSRIVPSIKSGKANGFKIYAIRPNSIYARLGIRNGDTIHSINGKGLTSIDKGLEIYSELKTASSLSVAITRRGKAEKISIAITE